MCRHDYIYPNSYALSKSLIHAAPPSDYLFGFLTALKCNKLSGLQPAQYLIFRNFN